MFRHYSHLNKSDFNEKILDWANEYGFKVDGNFGIFENANIDDFCVHLIKLNEILI